MHCSTKYTRNRAGRYLEKHATRLFYLLELLKLKTINQYIIIAAITCGYSRHVHLPFPARHFQRINDRSLKLCTPCRYLVNAVRCAETLAVEIGHVVELGPCRLDPISASSRIWNSLKNVDTSDISVGWRIGERGVGERVEPTDGDLITGVEHILNDIRIRHRSNSPWEEWTS
jgi:hypothetical protein